MASGRQAVQLQPTAKDAPKLNTQETKEKSLRNKCLTGRVLKGEQNKELGEPSTPWGHPNIRRWLVSRWKHMGPLVCDGHCYSLNLKPFGQPEFQNDVYKHSMKTLI